jgi:hypothetical protein
MSYKKRKQIIEIKKLSFKRNPKRKPPHNCIPLREKKEFNHNIDLESIK